MTVFYKCFKRTHEVNDPDAPVYRAVKIPKDKQEYDYVINVLCKGVLDQIKKDRLWWMVELFYCYVIESPFEKTPDGNIKYLVLSSLRFHEQFTPHTVDPWILSGGIDLSKCD